MFSWTRLLPFKKSDKCKNCIRLEKALAISEDKLMSYVKSQEDLEALKEPVTLHQLTKK